MSPAQDAAPQRLVVGRGANRRIDFAPLDATAGGVVRQTQVVQRRFEPDIEVRVVQARLPAAVECFGARQVQQVNRAPRLVCQQRRLGDRQTLLERRSRPAIGLQSFEPLRLHLVDHGANDLGLLAVDAQADAAAGLP